MKIAHRSWGVSWFAIPESDPVDDRYATQVKEATERGEHEYRQAQERLACAETRLAKTLAQKATAARRKRIAQLEVMVASRRAELTELERMMTTPVAADKQIRQRTGLDDHLELGEYKPQNPRRVPSGPVTRARLITKEDG